MYIGKIITGARLVDPILRLKEKNVGDGMTPLLFNPSASNLKIVGDGMTPLPFNPSASNLNDKKNIKKLKSSNKLISSSGLILIELLDIIRIGIQKLRVFRVLESVKRNSRGLVEYNILNDMSGNSTKNIKNDTIFQKNESVIDLFSVVKKDFSMDYFSPIDSSGKHEKNEKNEKKILFEKLLNDEYGCTIKFPDCFISISLSSRDSFQVTSDLLSSDKIQMSNSILNPIAIQFDSPYLLKKYLLNFYLGSLLR